jgi:WD40 repeat protein
VGFTPDSAAVLIGWRKSGAVVTRNEIATKQRGPAFQAHKSPVHATIGFRDGQILTAAANGEIKLWDRENKEIRSFVGHRGAINGAALSPDERRLVTTGTDRTVRIWDIATGLELFQLGKHTGVGMGVAFSSDGTRIASTAKDGSLRIWSIVDAPPIPEAPPPRAVVR